MQPERAAELPGALRHRRDEHRVGRLDRPPRLVVDPDRGGVALEGLAFVGEHLAALAHDAPGLADRHSRRLPALVDDQVQEILVREELVLGGAPVEVARDRPVLPDLDVLVAQIRVVEDARKLATEEQRARPLAQARESFDRGRHTRLGSRELELRREELVEVAGAERRGRAHDEAREVGGDLGEHARDAAAVAGVLRRGPAGEAALAREQDAVRASVEERLGGRQPRKARAHARERRVAARRALDVAWRERDVQRPSAALIPRPPVAGARVDDDVLPARRDDVLDLGRRLADVPGDLGQHPVDAQRSGSPVRAARHETEGRREHGEEPGVHRRELQPVASLLRPDRQRRSRRAEGDDVREVRRVRIQRECAGAREGRGREGAAETGESALAFARQDRSQRVLQRSGHVVDAAPARGALVAEAVVTDEDELAAAHAAALGQVESELGRRSGEPALDDDEIEARVAEGERASRAGDDRADVGETVGGVAPLAEPRAFGRDVDRRDAEADAREGGDCSRERIAEEERVAGDAGEHREPRAARLAE